MAKEPARKPGRASPASASACGATERRTTISSSISNRSVRPITAVMRRFALALLLPSLCGCYILTQAQGQLRVLLNSERIDTLLADRDVPDDVKLKLRLVREIKVFGE